MYTKQAGEMEAGHLESSGAPEAESVYGVGISPAMEDARRRFVLALRGMTTQREREERNRAAVEEWTRTLAQEIRGYRRWRLARRVRRLLRLAILIAVTWYFYRHNWLGAWWIWVFFGGGSQAADVAAGRRKETATALARARDPRAVNVLAVAVRTGDGATRKVAREGLIGILPGMRPDDAQHLTPQGWDALLGIVSDTKTTDADLLVAVMKGLEQIGDARAIPAVQKRLGTPLPMRLVYRVAARFLAGAPVEGWSLTRDLRRVQQAAQECLPFLLARADQERARTRLLRPAAAPDDPAAILLRPVTGQSDTPAEQLLRPTESR